MRTRTFDGGVGLGRPRRAFLLILELLLPALLGGLLSSCSPYWPMSEDLQRRIRAESDTLELAVTDDDAVLKAGEEAARGDAPYPEAFPLPERPGLDDYVGLALARNPRIQAAIRDVEALGMRVPQVTSLDDPMLDFVPPTGSMTQTAGGMMDGMIGVSQKIPFPAKLKAMGEVAERVVRMALENLRSTRLAVVSEVKKAYYRLYLATVSLEVMRESRGLLERLRAAADARYRSGEASQQDVLRAEVELYVLSSGVLTLEQEMRTAAARLNTLMDRGPWAEIPEPRSIDPLAVEWEVPALLARAVARNPELRILQERAERDIEAARLARLQYFPDLTVGGAYTFISGADALSPVATGDDVWNLQLGVNLPIWIHRIRAGILERNAEILGTALRYRGERNEIFFAVQDLWTRVDRDYRSAALFRDAVIPRARQALEVSEREYQAGRLGFTGLVENWRNTLDYGLEYHRAIVSLEESFAELERVVGGALARSAAEEEETREPVTEGNGSDSRTR